jgi:tRNA threonylcarbamoyladenosine biosynthesis protein TsaE
MQRRVFLTGSPSATEGLGKRVGERLLPGSVVALIGELGSGIPRKQVNSPTYAFVNEYRGSLPVLHMDLYRIDNVDMALDLDILDLLQRAKEGVAVIEWADRVVGLLSDGHLEVEFTVIASRKREITLTGFGEQNCRLLGELEGP